MESKSMLQIVSGFKPSVDGMGDFSRRLGAKLWEKHGIRSHFLIYKHPKPPLAAPGPEETAPNIFSYVSEPTPSSLRSHIAELRSRHHFDSVLLHYGPYAYSPDGKPTAFTQVIEELAPTTRLLVFFHEIFSNGWPWQRARWTRSEQQRCVQTLLRIADVAFTSNAKYHWQVQPFNPMHREILQVPIFSNIGEPEDLRPLLQRSRQLVVFGQLNTRVRLFKDCRRTLEDVCRKLRIEKIADVGSGTSPHIPAEVAGAPVTSAGFMEEQPLSDLMADSIAGIAGYWPDVWSKSGVIAAYQAHALVPIMIEVEKRYIPKPDFLPYISPERVAQLASGDSAASDASIQEIADVAHEHYVRCQSVNHCADVIAGSAISG